MSQHGAPITINELETLLEHLLQTPPSREGLRSVFLWGPAGIGKTESIKEFTNKKGVSFAYCAPAQFEEMGDFHGMPYIDGEHTRYKKPAWVPSETDPKGILLLDDFNRADIRIIKGMMQLIQYRELGNWKMPADWIIICTGNPDDEEYSTTSIDKAILTRFIHLSLVWDHTIWANWALNNNIRPEFVNFVLSYPELCDKAERTTPRTLTAFFKLIHDLMPIGQHTKTIEALGKSLLDEETVAAFFHFQAFQSSKLIEPSELLTLKDSKSIIKIVNALLEGENGVRMDLLNTLFDRLLIFLSNNPSFEGKSENLGQLLTVKSIPNDFRTKMYLELSKHKLDFVNQALKMKIVTNSLLNGLS
jgi:hypothetical protein